MSDTIKQRANVVLVSMPWSIVNTPSIQLGTLHATLTRAGIHVQSYSAYLDFADFLAERTKKPSSIAEMMLRVGNLLWHQGVGDWTFAVPPLHDPTREQDAAYREFLLAALDSGVDLRGPEDIALIFSIRERVPEFLTRAAQHILAMDPTIVGFSTVFSQNIPSVALAKVLKLARPELRIIFGGANCSGSMGEVIHRKFPWIDVVVRGEAEDILPQIVREIHADKLSLHSGVLLRQDSECSAHQEELTVAPTIEDIPVPNYDEYMLRARESSVMAEYSGGIRLPFETSRGCWWGKKHHCTFCGLNAASMGFRAKTPERALEDLQLLSRRYRVLGFDAVDNIIDTKYLNTFLPALTNISADFDLFYETKANLTRRQVRAMASAGVTFIQPGIESLDSSVLSLMKKGVTALQNIRLLKWCLEDGVRVTWSILSGFGGEDPAAYQRMAELVPFLLHIPPPNFTGILLNRYSPMFERPEEHGIRIVGPLPYYEHAYPMLSEQDRYDVAYFFDSEMSDGTDVNEYTRTLRDALKNWQKMHSGRRRMFLEYELGVDHVKIIDNRGGPEEMTQGEEPFRHHDEYVLSGAQAAIFLATDEGKTAKQVRQRLELRYQETYDVEKITEFLDVLVEARLVLNIDGKYLGLAIRRVGVRGQLQLPGPGRNSTVAPPERLVGPHESRVSLRVIP